MLDNDTNLSHDELAARIADRLVQDTANTDIITDWGEALAMFGLLEFGKKTGNQTYIDTVVGWVDGHLKGGLSTHDHWRDALEIKQGVPVTHFCGSWGIMLLAKSLYDETKDERLVEMAKYIGDFVVDKAQRTSVKGLKHTEDIPWLFADTVYYSIPGLVAASELTGDERYREEAIKQLEIHLKYLAAKGSELFHQSFNPETGETSPGYWGRGNGWIVMTLAEIADRVPEPVNTQVKERLQRMYAEIWTLQIENGMWRTQLERPDSYEESSAGLLFAYAAQLAASKGVDLGDFKPAFDKCWDGTRQYFTEQGELLQVSGETWLRWQDPDGYECIETGHRPWGTGSALLAAGTE
ncbi:glycoside hydrolase family 88 protein [Falsihalocynthiibacter sp. SS001]|uniref:glycoside hydrolase family 88 protein n=1 Tax=Falsihalocynthiibacter sp. SS001 TaxID=3349698 RepID=UPI0036D229FF